MSKKRKKTEVLIEMDAVTIAQGVVDLVQSFGFCPRSEQEVLEAVLLALHNAQQYEIEKTIEQGRENVRDARIYMV